MFASGNVAVCVVRMSTLFLAVSERWSYSVQTPHMTAIASQSYLDRSKAFSVHTRGSSYYLLGDDWRPLLEEHHAPNALLAIPQCAQTIVSHSIAFHPRLLSRASSPLAVSACVPVSAAMKRCSEPF